MPFNASIPLGPLVAGKEFFWTIPARARVCRGVELDPLYVDVIIRRWEGVSGAPAALIGTSEAFEEPSAHDPAAGATSSSS